MKPLTFGSLFAGIGGLDLGLERAGMECKWQVEIDEYGQRVLAKHWPDVRRHDDIHTWPTEDAEHVDLICGGFPCQDISYAGKGAGLDGERSGLFYELIRVVREMEPQYVLLENVAALLTRGLDSVLGTLASIGYDAEWHCIQAADVGAPHIRDRVFVLAHATSVRKRSGTRRGCNEGRCVLMESTGSRGDVDDCGPTLADASRQLLDRSGVGTEQTGRGELANSDWWAVEPAVGRVADGVPARVDRLRGLGNAVVPQVAEFIGKAIVEKHNQLKLKETRYVRSNETTDRVGMLRGVDAVGSEIRQLRTNVQ